jgi:hypothetical protein
MSLKTIFYSWQSSSPEPQNRYFIRDALKAAATKIGRDLEVVDSPRGHAFRVDEATQGVPGNPPIFDTILDKIKRCAIFVADFTFVGSIEDSLRKVPNPNVLVEYGYALGAVGDNRIIPVMNTAYGSPSPTSLPFNIGYRAIRTLYELPPSLPPDLTSTEKARLVGLLTRELLTIATSPEFFAGLSDGAVRLVEYFVRNSTHGKGRDPDIDPSELASYLAMDADQMKEAIAEAEERGLVATLRVLGGGGPVSPTEMLFVKFDRHFMEWDPMEDAKLIAAELLKTTGNQLVIEPFAERMQLSPRRINPALTYLVRGTVVDCSNVSSHPFAYRSILANRRTSLFLKGQFDPANLRRRGE